MCAAADGDDHLLTAVCFPSRSLPSWPPPCLAKVVEAPTDGQLTRIRSAPPAASGESAGDEDSVANAIATPDRVTGPRVAFLGAATGLEVIKETVEQLGQGGTVSGRPRPHCRFDLVPASLLQTPRQPLPVLGQGERAQPAVALDRGSSDETELDCGLHPATRLTRVDARLR